MSPITLMMFRTGSGHFDHLYSPVFSYLLSLFTIHLAHITPSYPVAQFTGWVEFSLNPPMQALGFMHS